MSVILKLQEGMHVVSAIDAIYICVSCCFIHSERAFVKYLDDIFSRYGHVIVCLLMTFVLGQ